jgi:ISXO2-like transposase domain/Transposase zinc-ribbon domain
MKKRSKLLLEFQERFRTEDDCLNALMQMRWPRGFVCPECGHDDGYRLSRARVIECAVCKKQTSITAGTMFHRTRIPLLHWLWMIFLVAQDKGGVSTLRVAKQLGMVYSTAWHVMHKIRQAMSERDNEVIRLAGLIELDEGFFGRKKPQCQVLVMIESGNKQSGNLVMKRILSTMASEPEVKRVVEAHVDNESQQHFVTDCAAAHNTLRKMGHKLETHLSTPESAARKLPWVHRAISLAKRYVLGTYHGINRKHLQRYLDEFCYRFNRRFKEGQLYESLIRACILATPVNYPALTR